ncbi:MULTISPECIES: hypothetical protein [Chryseobacterium]|uniref:hypothetical protein n=1 Tax=Chryseobacterium TaxID=59732 RepID=UPI0012950051|nr:MULTISPECIES: hypothetical protein [Chryseobacterium]MDR6920664.1 hypothetical protein [Chryseobacterium sp. 2987]
MKNLEKLESFQLENEKLLNVFGGEGGPAKPSFDLGVTSTGGGETSEQNWPSPGYCTTIKYTSDTMVANGQYIYHNQTIVYQGPN